VSTLTWTVGPPNEKEAKVGLGPVKWVVYDESLGWQVVLAGFTDTEPEAIRRAKAAAAFEAP
jgi:hypothetical protein